jgi:hypothetical protein
VIRFCDTEKGLPGGKQWFVPAAEEIRICAVLHFVKDSGQTFRDLWGFLEGAHNTGAGAKRAAHMSSVTRICMELLK